MPKTHYWVRDVRHPQPVYLSSPYPPKLMSKGLVFFSVNFEHKFPTMYYCGMHVHAVWISHGLAEKNSFP